MKILMTGTTTPQNNALKRPPVHKKLDVPAGVVHSMTELLGHEVTWRPAEIGKSLPECDLVWLNIAQPCSINSPFALCATWAIHQAIVEAKPLVIFFDDWQFMGVYSQYRTVTKIGERQFTKTLSGHYIYRGDLEEAVRWSDELLAISAQIADRESEFWGRVTNVVPRYSGFGDRSIVEARMGKTVREIDPTPYAHRMIGSADWAPSTVDFETKRQEWTLASLMSHDKWVEKLKLSWPVQYFGSMKLKAPRLPSESAVLDEYRKRWGALAPAYPHDGSGWFRTRYAYSAIAGSILLCGPGDALALGPAYEYNGAKIERMDQNQLLDLAIDQWSTIWPKLQTSEAFVADQVNAAMADAIGRAR